MRGQNLPEGTPITMRIDFGADNLVNLDVSTKAEAPSADEERVHDLYVMVFCDGEGDGHVTRGQKIYGRYFSYEHLQSDLSALNSSPNEGWFVENRTINNSVTKTRGAVKISTKVCSSAKLVVIANVDNGICKIGDQDDVLDYLNSIRTYDELRQAQVKLTQDIVNRKNLFLMLGVPEDGNGDPKNVNTGDMVWNTEPISTSTEYNTNYRVYLRPVDAKVKFKIRVDEANISASKAVYWEVCNVPNRCYLFSDYDEGRAPQGTVYFGSEQAYFEGTIEDGGDTWYIFSFYMLESRFAAKAHADQYYKREKQVKTNTDKTGYGGSDTQYYVENGEWIYALPNAPYVKFDMILTLTSAGITDLIGSGGSVNHALTSDTIYTVHLGDFSKDGDYKYDDYNTLRGTCYTYEITIVNSSKIYAEVKNDTEDQPGQEGYILLTDDEIVNADCHYEYHSITFTYDPETSAEKFSWYVKTPFTSPVGGGPQKSFKTVNGVNYPVYDPHDTDGTLLDYRWVKFGVNKVVDGKYTTNRLAYPGNGKYDKDWGVGEHGPWDSQHPELMDISQLIQYIFEETKKETASSGSSDFKTDSGEKKVIRVTIFIDEYYYEADPRDESDDPPVDPNLWRSFVNAKPREMHILSKTTQSRDRKSDVIESSHSVIQQSIQTIYNIYEPTLRSIWGCEHVDEIKKKEPAGTGDWLYWPENCSEAERSGANTDIGKENGRLNSAYIWGLYNRQDNSGSMTTPLRDWNNFLNYEVDNKVPELRDDDISDDYGTSHHYHGMAWSCLTRNRDNDGNGKIDPEEIRWYMAASQQLTGLWIGNESLSTSARLYQPAPGQWRAHVVSSTDKRVAWAEEGAGATQIKFDWKAGGGGPNSDYHTWETAADASVAQSVRCIRNIGTYDDGGVVKDISEAPVTTLPDKYFTLERSDGGDVSNYDNPEASYVFYFDRLNTKSIREFSSEELPYHDQNSLNNRVYVKMITQPLSSDVPTYSESWKDINNLVTTAGYNEYCPAGYRFPNHTEWLLMSLYLPESYLKKDKDGNGYSGTYMCPSRTYYDRGYYGSLRSETAAWQTEKNKVGWIFSDKLHCSPITATITHSRCVKDEDQTGIISGQIAVEGNTIYPGDLIPVDFKFSSTASTFTSATLTLWYTKNGFRTPYDLTSQMVTPKGLQYKGVQSIRIPTLADLGISASGFSSADMSIEASFTNLSGQSGSHELAVTMKNPLNGTLTADEYFYPNDTQGGSFTYSFSTESHTVELTSVSFKLCYTDQNSTLQERTLSTTSISGRTYSGGGVVDVPTLSVLGLDTYSANLNHPMTIEATITSADGLTYTKSTDVTLVSHLTGSSVQFPTEYNATNGIPVDIVVQTVAGHNATVSSATFYWKVQGGEYAAGAPLAGAGSQNMSTREFVKNIIGTDVAAGSKYYFYLTATCSDGTSMQTDIQSMEILYYDKCWNSGTENWQEGEGHKASDITHKWAKETIGNLHFDNGDFIDTYIDVTNCRFIPYDGNANNDIGMDNLITIGVPYPSKQADELLWKRNGNEEIYIYYPAHNPKGPNNEDLQGDYIQIAVHDANKTVTRVRPYTLNGVLTVRLEDDSLLINGGAIDWSQNCSGNNSSGNNSATRSEAAISAISSASTLKIGSIEGQHRSRATYKYVRVVRNEGPLTP